MTYKVIVVGGGITGLCVAYELTKALSPDQVLLIEKRERLGGVILTEEENGVLLEGGPDCLYAEKPWAIELAQEIGLGWALISPQEGFKGTYILWKRKLHKLPEGFLLLVPRDVVAFLKTGLLSPWGKARALLEPFVPPKRSYEDEDLASFVKRRLGKEVLERIVDPLIGGVHGSSASELSAKAVLPRFVEMEKKWGSLFKGVRHIKTVSRGTSPFLTFIKGMGQLVEGLVERLRGVRFALGEEVLRVEPLDGSIRVHTDKGVYEAERVVLAVPARQAREILGPTKPDSFSLLGKFSSVPTIVLNVVWKEEDISGVKGYGFVVSPKEGLKLKAVSFSSRKFERRAPDGMLLMRLFFSQNEDLVGFDNQAIFELALKELRAILRVKGAPLFWKVYKWPEGLAQMRKGHFELVESLRKALVREARGVFVVGSSYDGIGISDCVRGAKAVARKLLEGLLGQEGGEVAT